MNRLDVYILLKYFIRLLLRKNHCSHGREPDGGGWGFGSRSRIEILEHIIL